MKRTIAVLLVASLAAGTALAQELEVKYTGEVKTGVYWEHIEEAGTETIDRAVLGNNDDAGEPGRIRVNLLASLGNVGLKIRFENKNFNVGTSPVLFGYAFGYGNFINNQLTLSAGRLGDSPWATGGHEINLALDDGRAGLRTEIKPYFLPGLNIGFVLNEHNNTMGEDDKTLLQNILAETILGASYTHEFFEARFSYRLDAVFHEGSETERGDHSTNKNEGMDMTYRVEEKFLRTKVDGFSIWANGYWHGIEGEELGITNYENWLYVQYIPGDLDAQLRVGFNQGYKKNILTLKPVVQYNVLPFLILGATFIYARDFGEAAIDSPYSILAIEPLVRVNFSTMYVALVYRYTNAYTAVDRIKATNWVNLRFVYTL
jgi:hypothetical protein